MANSRNSAQRVVWVWNSSPDPWTESAASQWTPYSDAESLIIEEAFSAKKSIVTLDDYYIDLENELQISTTDIAKQRPIQRIIQNNEERRYREERFLSDPIAPKRLTGPEYESISPFIVEARRILNLKPEHFPSSDTPSIPMIVEKAAAGIIEEGRSIGMPLEAEKLAEILLEKKNKGIKEIWACCAYLYSMESFLYKKLNAIMRQIGSHNYEQVWREKVLTLGPFCLLLWDGPFGVTVETNKTLYRPAKLTSEQLETYRNLAENPNERRSFQAFTSCTRNRSVAESFPGTNALFIINLLSAFSVDLQPVSLYPAEEEELISPGVWFAVESVRVERGKNKFLINLKLDDNPPSNNEATAAENVIADYNGNCSLSITDFLPVN
ncbi:unnamed protein product [Rotaria socialis]|uniref:NAD(P)(+)--arginine ADP-ribosyltransferase n=1 Tax=Rotaria socialis TaxID=392032 RepID=A0A821DTI4_9BILA|nr:unnamed protein product [Rotaria socialis]